MKLLRKILFPLNPLYYVAIYIRNKCFDFGVFSSKTYEMPIICVGNLSVGGTGKTPMVEYLIQMLKPSCSLAVLSRGYGRKTDGFILADSKSTAQILGDEPIQIAQKFPDIKVAVDADRRHGIKSLKTLDNPAKIIILDDAFQHRAVKAGLSIILTSYDNLYCQDVVLPAGNLREPRSAASRAQIIVVTKCPEDLPDSKKQWIKDCLRPMPSQQLFFSSIVYSQTIIAKKKTQPLEWLKNQKFSLVTGIAKAAPMVNYLENLGLVFDHLEFSDHHVFSNKELDLIGSKSLVLTTEKDFFRLESLHHPALYYLPINIQINASTEFETLVADYVKKFD